MKMTNTHEFRTEDVILDKANAYIYTPQLGKTGDIGARILRVQVVDKGVIKDQTGLTLILNWHHLQAGNSGMDTFVAIDPLQGLFEVTYPDEMMLEGVVECNITIREGEESDMRLINTRNFKLTVEKSANNPDAAVVSNSFGTLQEILSLWHNLPEEFAAAVKAFNHFKGSYRTVEELAAAWNAPTPGTQGLAKDGDYAFVGEAGVDAQQYIWDTTDSGWIISGYAPYSPEEIKAIYESNPNTNAFTDSYKSKLGGIAPGAEVNVQANWAQTDTAKDDYIKNKPDIYGTNGQPVAGIIVAWGSDAIPDGWLLCDGREVSRATYDRLYAAIGTTYGAGNGTTTFNLPDPRGRYVAGAAPNDAALALGYKGGSTNPVTSHNHPDITFTVKQNAHEHKVISTNGDAEYMEFVIRNYLATGSQEFQSKSVTYNYGGWPVNSYLKAASSTATNQATKISIPNSGSNTNHANWAPYQTANYIISTGLQGAGGINYLAGSGISFTPAQNGNVVISADSVEIHRVVLQLPEIGEENVIFMVPSSVDPNALDNFIWTNEDASWHSAGQTHLDMSEYRRASAQDEIDAALATKAQLAEAVNNAVQKSDLPSVLEPCEKVANKTNSISEESLPDEYPTALAVHAGLAQEASIRQDAIDTEKSTRESVDASLAASIAAEKQARITALELKVDKVDGYGLSENNYTAAEKAKLAALDDNHFKGSYPTLEDLEETHPVASDGDYAYVGTEGTDAI
jgi:microcystin-dependent protein